MSFRGRAYRLIQCGKSVLIAGVFPDGDGKDVVEIFERSLFRFCSKKPSGSFLLKAEDKEKFYVGGEKRS